MTIFPGCKCCGPCWKCYGKELDCKTIIPYWDNIIPDNYQNAFRLSSPSVDSSGPPIEQTDKRLAWGDPLFLDDHATYNNSITTSSVFLTFYVGNGYSDTRTRQFSMGVQACFNAGGVDSYRINAFVFSGESHDLSSLKHISTDGTETSLSGTTTVWQVDLPMNEDSPFFLGQYVAEYFDGRKDIIELKSGYQILNNISLPVDHQCFETPPTESGWLPVGDCHPDEAACEAACPPTGGRTMPQTKTGPGTHLKEMLEAWGIHAKKSGGCKCKDMEVKMNRLGSDCKEPANLKMIVDHLQAEAKKRKLPFVRKAGELLVLRAVKRFEKES